MIARNVGALSTTRISFKTVHVFFPHSLSLTLALYKSNPNPGCYIRTPTYVTNLRFVQHILWYTFIEYYELAP